MRVYTHDFRLWGFGKQGEIKMRLLKKGPIFCICSSSGIITGNIVYEYGIPEIAGASGN
jgi:hypothetical protein